jgi:hypothetical protein
VSAPIYNPNIPQPKDRFNTSDVPFLNNFGILYDSYAVNHIPLDSGTSIGEHTIVQMTQQKQNFQTNLDEIAVYTRPVTYNVNGSDLTSIQTLMRYQNNATEFKYSNYQIYPLDDKKLSGGGTQTTFITFLPGNLLVYFGEIDTLNKVDFLELDPYISKNILSVNFCSIGVLAFPLGIANIVWDTKNQIAKQLQVGFTGNLTVGVPPSYYMVVTQT